MNESEQLFEKTVAELQDLSERLATISEFEETFSDRIQQLANAANHLIDRQKEIEETLDRFEGLLNDMQGTMERVDTLRRRLGQFEAQLAGIDFRGLDATMQEVNSEMGKATAKISAAASQLGETPSKRTPSKK